MVHHWNIFLSQSQILIAVGVVIAVSVRGPVAITCHLMSILSITKAWSRWDDGQVPSKILGEVDKEFYTKKIKLNKESVAELAKKTLL